MIACATGALGRCATTWSADYQDKLARFLENHDEPQASATFSLPQHRAAAAIVSQGVV